MSNKIDPLLLSKVVSLGKDKKIDCIIQVKNFDYMKKYLKDKKINIKNEYLFIKAFFIEGSKEDIFDLSQKISVTKIYSISTASMMMNVSKKILLGDNQDLTGEGVNVGIIDTGIAPHFDFYLERKRVEMFIDFVAGRKIPYDDNGHGTFVSGVFAGSGAQSGGKYSGIAPKAKIFSLKALDKKGEAYSNKILDAMEWVYNNHKKYKIKVVCMSFGSEPLDYNDPIMLGAEMLWKEGVTVVTAAGNSGPEFRTIKSPGISPRIITVGGFDDNRIDENTYDEKLFEIADFSSRGPAMNRFKPDLIAPAVNITSCDKNGGYVKLSGTSVATPMVAGLATLLIQKYPEITPDRVKQMLISNAKGITYNKNLEGYGIPKIY